MFLNPHVAIAATDFTFVDLTWDGFGFPYGDYFEMDVDEQGTNHLIFGEGPDYAGTGSIWYVKGK